MDSRLVGSRLGNVKCIVLFEHGRLGNQFFQYIAARAIAPSAEIICIGYHSLDRCLAAGVGHTVNEKWSRLLRGFFRRLGRDNALRLSKHSKIFGRISEGLDGSRSFISFNPGLWADISLLDGFFQDEQLLAGVSCLHYPLCEELLGPARQWVVDNIVSRGRNPYFLHVRRGDYVHWPAKDAPAVLPYRWCKQQMQALAGADDSAHFVVCSDDIPYVEEWFGSNSRVSIFRGSELQDFALMTQCSGGGILSASTFAWWAAWYGRQFFPNSRYVAPRYWAGWRQGEWYPSTIQTSWLEYSDARPEYGPS